jgi:alpha-L-fucosidase
MDVNGESIYGTTASPLDAVPAWGVVTAKANRLYLHVLKWPTDGKLKLKHDARPMKARLLADGSDCAVTIDAGEIVVSLPKNAPDPVDSVVVIECATP